MAILFQQPKGDKGIMKVNNKKSIYKIAGRSLASNKRRNVITIAAIILTAILFTSLFTIIMSINASYEMSVFRKLGGSSHGTFKDITAEQEADLIKNDNIKEYGERMILGINSDDVFHNQSAEISYMDANTAEWSFIELEDGHMPEAYNEIVMDKEALKLLGYEPVLGEQIDLSFEINGKGEDQSGYRDTFTLVGYWEFDPVSPAHFINVSKEYAESIIAIAEDRGLEPIRINMDVKFSSPVGAEDKMIRVIEESGYTCGDESTDESIRYGINPGYTSGSMDGTELIEILVPMSVFLLLVIFTGYLIIYNVFQISVVSDIRFYGLLKTIGTTQKQVKKIIKIQALVLCAIGIPAGLILGYILGSWLTPVVLQITTMADNCAVITTSPIVFIASGFFEIVTVMISVIKPGKTAGKVSPIEALKYNESISGGKKKKNTRGAKPFDMALANVGRNKKKTMVVFVSLALSLVVLNAVNMFTGGFDSEKWLESEMSTDFVIGDLSYFKFAGPDLNSMLAENAKDIKENVAIENDGFAYDLTGLPLLKLGKENYEMYHMFQPQLTTKPSKESGQFYSCSVIEGMDDFLIDRLEVCEGDASLLKDRDTRYVAILTHKLENGEYVLDENAPEIGEKISLAWAEGIEAGESGNVGQETEDSCAIYTGITEYEYTVCAYVEVPIDISERMSSGTYDVIVGSDMLRSDFGESVVPLFYAFDTASVEDEEKAENYIHDYCEENTGITYESKAVRRADFEGFKNMFVLVGGLLSLIIGFVGILNFLNTIMAGIITRKNEIAVLQAIGMTGKQVKEMLITEGMIYTAGSGVIALILSVIFVPVVNAVSNELFWFYSDHFSITPILMVLPIMALLGIIVPLVSYKGLSKASIVERIREIG